MKREFTPGYILSRILIVVLLFLTFLPILVMLNMACKQTVIIRTDFWGIADSIYKPNWIGGFDFIGQPILNSLYICGVSIVGILFFVALSGYAFGKMKFKGKQFIFAMIIFTMMIPYVMLIIPNFEIVYAMGVINTYWAIIIPYVFGGSQIIGVMLAQTFFQELPDELFEAAKIDGANEWQRFMRIGLPLSKPILITVGVTTLNSFYNDYMWPTIVLTVGDKMKTFCQLVYNTCAGKGANDVGMIAAAFTMGTIPLVVLTSFVMKHYISGITIGAVKG